MNVFDYKTKKDFMNFIEKGGDLNKKDVNMEEVLCIELNNLDLEFFKKKVLFLRKEKKLDLKDKHGRNLLFWIEDIEKVKYLVDELHMEFNLLSDNSCSPIFFKNPEVTEFYFKKGLSIDKKSDDCFSVLSVAAPETTKKLVDLGVDINDSYVFMSWIPRSEHENEEKKLNEFHEKIRFLYSKGMKIEHISYMSYYDDLELLKIITENEYSIPYADIFKSFSRLLYDKNYKMVEYIQENYLKNKTIDFLSSIVNDNNCVVDIKMMDFLNTNYNINSKLKIDGMPWFFKANLKYESLNSLKNNPLFYHRNDNNENILFYKNKKNNDICQLLDILNINPELMLEKNNDNQNFFENMNKSTKREFISLIMNELEESEYREDNKEDLCNNIIKKIIFIYIEKNGIKFLEKNEENLKLIQIYTDYEKEKIKKEINDESREPSTFRRL